VTWILLALATGQRPSGAQVSLHTYVQSKLSERQHVASTH